MMKPICLCTLWIVCVFITQLAAQEPANDSSNTAAQMTFQDIDGQPHTLPCSTTSKCTVFVFINTECPIANAYHPALTRIKQQFADSNFDFVMIHADSAVTLEAARVHRQEYQIKWAIALDPENKLARRVSAKVTPEAIVVDAAGKVLYRGRIDDRHQAYGRKRPAPTTNDLHDALVAIRDDLPIARPETKAVGCIIRYADK